MEKAIKARGETPFDEAGDGVVLCFKNTDLVRIQQKYGKNFLTELTEQIMFRGELNMEAYVDLLDAGLKKDRKALPYKDAEDKLDAIPIVSLLDKIFDALYVSVYGSTLQEYMKEMAEKIERAKADGEAPSLLSPDMTSSSISDVDLSGPESA